jgi:hypothetical protein
MTDVDPDTLKGRDRPLYIKSVLEKLGWRDFQAAAMVGQCMQESYTDCRTNVWGDQHTAYGICQWRDNYDKKTGVHTPGRLTDLGNFAVSTGQSISSIKTQALFINYELTKGSQQNVGRALKKTKNIDEALRVAIGYEHPRGYTTANPENGDGFANRGKYAKSLL